MNPKAHANQIFDDLRKQAIAKYMAGQKEHGGKLWEIPLPEMVGFAKEEVIDQGSYLWTIADQITTLRLLLGELFESLEASEEPPSNGEKDIIEQVRKMLDL